MGPWGVVIAFVALLSLIKIEGKPVIDFKDIAARSVVWDVYFLVCMAMVISDALTEESTGIKPFLTYSLNPLLGGQTPAVFTAIAVLFCMVITQFANNAVMGVLLMPIVFAFCQQNGTNPAAAATAMTFALHVAIMTPAASPYAAILYGNKDWVDGKEIFKYGGIIAACSALLYILVGTPLANLIL
jgi:sodium-dependent dicarboxylate transporter 2/3/5